MMRSRILLAAIFSSALTAATPAAAQPAPAATPPAPDTTAPQAAPGGGLQPATPAGAAPTAAAQEEARVRFERGTQLYNDGAYDLALIELQRAYDLVPSYKLLYNIGQVNAQLSNYAGALRAFEKYLSEGGADVSAGRRAEVEKEIQTLRGRTANLTVRANVPDAEILVDGLPLTGQAPDSAFMVNAGVRRIGIRKPGYELAERVLTLAGGDSIEVKLDMVESPSGSSNQPFTLPPPRKERSYVWVGWVGTGVLAAGAVITGIAALGASNDLDDELDKRSDADQSPAEKKAAIDDVESRRMTLAITTDILAGAAIVVGGVTLAFTIVEANDDDDKAATPRNLRVGVRPNGLDLAGSF